MMTDKNWKSLAVPTAVALSTTLVLLGLVLTVIPSQGMAAPWTVMLALLPILAGFWVFDRLSSGMDRAARRSWLRNRLPGIRERENRDAAERARESRAAKDGETPGP